MERWKQILKKNFTNLTELASFLQLDEQNQKKILRNTKFILNLPKRLAEKIEKNSLKDPIFQQFVPMQEEKKIKKGFIQDPVQDTDFQKQKKLLHKYSSRALLLTTSACAMHCRYCFRQNFPYETKNKGYEAELQYLQKHQEIEEVILSGGDPLSLSDEKLQQLITSIESAPHVQRLRFHTRFLIGIPERVTAGFLEILKKTRLQSWLVIHCNHPKELDQDVLSSLKKIQKLGIPVLNQSVLLKGVNDSLQTQVSLCQTLINHGVFPYYIHQLDPVKQAWHFHVEKKVGIKLIKKLQQTLSGYGVPKFVQEVPFEEGKTLLQS